MNHDRTFAVTRLRNIVLSVGRGEMDGEFIAAIEAGLDIEKLREAMIERCRWLADEIEARP